MLFPGLQGHSQGPVSLGIHTHTDNSSGDGSFEIFFGSKKSSMRTAETYGNAKTLCRTDSNIRTQFTWRREQRKGQQIGCHHHKTTDSLYISDKGSVFRNITLRIWILNNGAKISFIHPCFRKITCYQFYTQGFSAGYEDVVGLLENGMINKKFRNADVFMIPVFLVKEHDHRFSGCGSFIEQGCIGQWKSGEITYQGLEIQQAFQPAL